MAFIGTTGGVMDPHPHSFEGLHDRLARLEIQQRRLKRLGAAALIIATLLVVMGQAPSKKIVEANEFILKDDSGNVRARLFMTEKHTTNLTIEGKSVPATNNPSPTLALYGEKLEAKAWLNDHVVGFNSSQGDYVDAMLGMGLLVLTSEGSTVAVQPPTIRMSDAKGYSAVLGETELQTTHTGQTQKTSAASLVMFDKDKNVIWKAP
jgi:hypothetical protein